MRSPLQTAPSWLAFFLFSHISNASIPSTPTPLSVNKAMLSEGCFSSSGTLVNQGLQQYQTSLTCQPICVGMGMSVMALQNGSNCWCGDLLPAASSKVDAAQCNIGCYGFGTEQCGGQNTWTVYLTGTNNNVGSVDSSGSANVASTTSAQVTTSLTSLSSPSSSGTTTLSEGAALLVSTLSTAQAVATSFATSVIAPTTVVAISVISMTPSVLTVGGATIVQTVGATTAPTLVPNSSYSQKPETHHTTNTAGIAAGVVVGIVVLAAIIGGSVYYVQRKNRESHFNGHRRNTSLNAFTPGAGMRRQVSDSRLDPAMVEKRRSGGSVFADNVDYSRRILKVTNPDGT